MSTDSDRSLESLIAEALREEYLDLLMLAGRLARQNAARAPIGGREEAHQVRKLIRDLVTRARKRLKLGRFSGAPEAIVEAEMAIVAFLDWAALKRFDLENWDPLREIYYQDYLDAGRDNVSVSDLGKYLYGRLEDLRRNPDKLQRASLDLLSVYSCCLRLGYLASYDERPNELAELRAKLDEALRTRRGSAQKAAFSPPSSAESDLRLTPNLPPIEQAGAPPLVLNPLWIGGIALALLVVMGVSLRIALLQKERATVEALDSSRQEILKLAADTDDICREPAAHDSALESSTKVSQMPRRAPGLRRRSR